MITVIHLGPGEAMPTLPSSSLSRLLVFHFHFLEQQDGQIIPGREGQFMLLAESLSEPFDCPMVPLFGFL